MISAWTFAPLRAGAYDLIVADPPWRFRTWNETNQAKSASRHYRLMTTDAIKALPVASLAAPDCALLLWSTGAMQREAFACLDAWGFRYKSQVAWVKTTINGKRRMGTGYWARTMHEPVLIATRGNPRALRLPSVIDGVAREHSRKPDEFYDLIRDRTPGLSRCDLFSRQTRPGFDGWGNEHGKLDGVAS